MNDTPTIGRTIEKEIVIDASPERVFDAFTQPDLLEKWFVSEATVDLQLGGSWRFTWEPEERIGGEYVVIDRPHRLVWTWNEWWLDERGEPRGDEGAERVMTTCEVVFEPEGDGTRIRLIHTGYPQTPDWDDSYNGTDSGWDEELEHLRAWIEEGTVRRWEAAG